MCRGYAYLPCDDPMSDSHPVGETDVICARQLYEQLEVLNGTRPVPPFRVLLNPWQAKLWIDLGFPAECLMVDPRRYLRIADDPRCS